jgi:small conductance mechanosensitive channel
MSRVSRLFASLSFVVFLCATVIHPAGAQDDAQTVADIRAIEEAYTFSEELLDPHTSVDELHIWLAPLIREELAALATKWLQMVKAKSEEVARAQVAIMKSEGVVEDSARRRLDALTEERKVLLDRFSTVLDSWDRKGGKSDVIAAFHGYRAAVLLEETRSADIETLYARFTGWLTDPGGALALALRIIFVVVGLYGLMIAARIISGIVKRRIGRVPNISKLLQISLSTVAYWIVLSIGLMISLSALGLDITPLFALFGGVSFIAGIALQDTLGNLANGFMILINRPFDEGDYVDLGAVAGTVNSVNIAATTITTIDNQQVVIPNRQVWGNIITNVTANDSRCVLLVFSIGYDDDIKTAISVLRDTVSAHPLAFETPEPAIMVGELAESSVNILCRPWTKTGDYLTVYWDLTRQVKENFERAGISTPYPRRDVRVHRLDGNNPVPSEA